jgi:hypothetical protein
VDPSSALADSINIYSKLPGKRVLSLGGGNGAGHWTATSLNNIITAIKTGRFDTYTGIAYDIEEGESGLSALFTAAFAATKARGMTCIVTVSHSAPYAMVDAATVMRAIFADPNVDYLSPQLYSTGYEVGNEWAESGGVSWNEYKNCRAKIIPSIVTSSMYENARLFFGGLGITTAGYIQWQQGPNALRCGVDWNDANNRCGTSCPTGSDSSCPSGQKCFANVNPNACGTASANEATVVDEQQEQQQTTTTTPSGTSEQVPAWAIALLALGSILVVGVFTALVVLLKPKYHSERV